MNTNKHCKGKDDDQSCVIDGKVSANRMKNVLTSLNMMKNLIGKEELVMCSDDTYTLDLNGHQIMVMGATDKH